MASPPPVHTISSLLTTLATPQNDNPNAAIVFKNAERSLTTHLTQPSVLLPLLNILTTHPAPPVRQMAAVLLRRVIKLHYVALPFDHRKNLRQPIFRRIAEEPQPGVRRAIVALAAVIVRSDSRPSSDSTSPHQTPDDAWMHLLQIAMQLVSLTSAQPPRPNLADWVSTGYTIFRNLCETIPDLITDHLPPLVPAMERGLSHPDLDIRQAAANAFAASIIPATTASTTTVQALCKLLPLVVSVANEGDPLVVSEFFEVLCMFTDIGSIFNPYFLDSVRFGLKVFRFSDDVTCRAAAQEFLMHAARSKPNTIKKADMASEIINAALKIVLDETEDYPEEDELSLTTMGLQLLETVAGRIELCDLVFTSTMAVMKQVMTSPQPLVVSAGYRIMGAISEGCRQQFSHHAPEIVEQLVRGCQYSRPESEFESLVRCSALDAIACVCANVDTDEMVGEDVLQSANVCMSAVLAAMQDPSVAVKKSACRAFEPAILMFPDPMMLRVHEKEISTATASLGAQMAAEAVAAVGSLAEHACEFFAESTLYISVLDGIKRLMSDTSEEAAVARAAAIETAGILVVSTPDKNVVEELSRIAITALESDEQSIKHATFTFFSHMIDHIGGLVMPVFGVKLLEAAAESLEREDVVRVTEEEEVSLFPVSVETEEEDYKDFYNIRTAFWEERLAAVNCVGSIATAMSSKVCQEKYTSRIDAEPLVNLMSRCLVPVRSCASLYHGGIRAGACRAQARMASSNAMLAAANSPLSFVDEGFMKTTLEFLLTRLIEDEDFWVVTIILDALSVYMTEIPAALVLECKAQVIEALRCLILGQSECQLEMEVADEEEESMKRGDDRVGQFVDAIGEVIEALAYSLRGYFARHFSEFFYDLTNLYTTDSTPRNQGLVTGAVAGVLTFLTWERCDRFDPPPVGHEDYERALQVADAVGKAFLPHALEAVKNPASKVLQKNAVFLLGVIYTRARPVNNEVWSKLPEVLKTLQALIGSSRGGSAGTTDNASGAIARIVSAQLSAGVGKDGEILDQIQPVLRNVPCKEEVTENTPVSRAILHLARKNLDALLHTSVVSRVASTLVTVVLLSNKFLQTERFAGWTGIGTDLVDDFNQFSPDEVKDAVRLMKRIAEVHGAGLFSSLKLTEEDAKTLHELMKVT